jgi:heavy metal sensor kinase
MNALARFPIRVRVTLGFAAAMGVLLAVIAWSLYVGMGIVLLDEIDTGLRSRAVALAGELPQPNLVAPTRGLIEGNEAFAQVLDRQGRLIDSSPGLARPLLMPAELRRVLRPTFFDRRIEGVFDVARLLVVPERAAPSGLILVVGTSMSDRSDALKTLTVFFGVAGPLALLLASFAGWVVAGSALRPVERMRGQASAISASGMDRRLTMPVAEDEIRRLAITLNEMLARLEESILRERRFLDDASHELRTPLTALKSEIDVARSRPRSAEELSRALASASEETDRLARLADDLLVLSRARNGRVPLLREETSLPDLLASSAKLFRARADASHIRIETSSPEAHVFIDGIRVRQALDNLVDNALRHSRSGGGIELRAGVDDGFVRIEVSDDGPGFPVEFLGEAFEPFSRATTGPHADAEGAGLGLAIVRAVAASHGGHVSAENRPEGGARVTLTINVAPTDTS